MLLLSGARDWRVDRNPEMSASAEFNRVEQDSYDVRVSFAGAGNVV